MGEGTGLGLANVNLRLIAHYGESVRLRSFPFGTVVRLEVPVGETHDDPRAARRRRGACAVGAPVICSRRMPDVQVVGEAASAREALDARARRAPDVVFLDVEMPGLTGVEAAPLRARARATRRPSSS